jgi:hypothetical protein
MTVINPVGTLGRQMAATGPRVALAASVIATVAFAAISYHSLPREALLPATVTLVFVLAAVVALFALAGSNSASTIHLLGRCRPAHTDRCHGFRDAGTRRSGSFRRRPGARQLGPVGIQNNPRL